LIQQMAQENRLWGAERMRGELLKRGLSVAKQTIQKYSRRVRPPKPPSQTWAIFLKNHAKGVWAFDFLPVISWSWGNYICIGWFGNTWHTSIVRGHTKELHNRFLKVVRQFRRDRGKPRSSRSRC
jgi:hypothetical protein